MDVSFNATLLLFQNLFSGYTPEIWSELLIGLSITRCHSKNINNQEDSVPVTTLMFCWITMK